MERRIAFLPDRRGKSIAYATLGHGRPLVCNVGLVSHLDEQWTLPAFRRFFEVLAESHRVILYDPPGIGLGDAGGSTLTLQDDFEVLEDLVDGLGAPTVDLFAASQAAAVMLAYAAQHPHRVERLIVFGGYAYGGALNRPEFREAFLQLLRTNWGLGSKLASDIWMPGADNRLREWFARWVRASATPDVGVRRFAETYSVDVRDLLSRVDVPVLVLHRRGDKAVRFELGNAIAAGIPNAHFVPLDGDVHFFFLGDVEAVLRPLLEFLGDKRTAPVAGELSPRELEVAGLIHQGLSNAEIGTRLKISERTAESHAEHIRNKLGFRSRAQIAGWVAERLT